MEGADVVKVFVAGASGAIGRVLIPQLVAAGHEVVGTTRREARAAALREAGAEAAVVCDAFDADAVRAAVAAAAPEVVVDQLTSLPRDYNIRDPTFYAANDRVRREGTANVDRRGAGGGRAALHRAVGLVPDPAGRAAGARRGRPAVDRRAAPFTDSVAVLVANERAVTGADGLRRDRAALRPVLRPGDLLRLRRLDRRRGPPPPLPGRRRGDRAQLVRPRRRRRGGDRRRGVPRCSRQSTTSPTTNPPSCASGCPPTPRRSGPRSRFACRSGWPAWSPARWRRRWLGATRGVECAGEGGVAVDAGGGVVADGLRAPRRRSELSH